MVKKFTAILLYSIACLIQFGHSVVPHDHAEPHTHGSTGHHHHHEGDENENDDRSIFHYFVHFGSTAEIFTNQTEEVKLYSYNKIQIINRFSYPDLARFVQGRLPIIPFYEGPDIYISPHLLSSKFRGPPTV